MLKLAVSLSILFLFTGCIDFRQPWYGYYRWSGERTEDKKKFNAMQALCWELLEPPVRDNINRCNSEAAARENDCNTRPASQQDSCKKDSDKKKSMCIGWFDYQGLWFTTYYCAEGMASTFFGTPPGEFKPVKDY